MVRVEYRGQGIGKRLWQASWRALGYSESSAGGEGEVEVDNVAVQRVPEYIGLTTFSTNPMVHFYKQYGFEIVADDWDQMTYGGNF